MAELKSDILEAASAPPSPTILPRKKPFSEDGYEINALGVQVKRYAFYTGNTTRIDGVDFVECGNFLLELVGKFETLLSIHKRSLNDAGIPTAQFALLDEEIEKIKAVDREIVSFFERDDAESFEIDAVIESLGFHITLAAALQSAYYLAIYEVDFLGQVPSELRVRDLSPQELGEELEKQLVLAIKKMGEAICPNHPFAITPQMGLGSDDEESGPGLPH